MEQREELERQLKMIRRKSVLLDEIEERLKRMRSIAEYAAGTAATDEERGRLNKVMKNLQEEISLLEGQVDSDIH